MNNTPDSSEIPSPETLDNFWRGTIERTRSAPLDASEERVPERVGYFKHRVTYQSLDGVPVRAYLCTPADQPPEGKPPRQWPALITAPGYGGWEFYVPLAEAQRGCAILQIYPRGMGESGELWSVAENARGAWINHGPQDPEGFYYQGAYMDLLRGVDYLCSRSDIDTNRIGVMGVSGGGQLALGLAAVDPRIKAVVAALPALCDLVHTPSQLGSPEVQDPTFRRTWQFFEPVNLAPRITAPTLLTAGGKDATCPPDTIEAVYKQLAGIKGIVYNPDLIHTADADFYVQGWQWIERYCFR